MRAINCPDPTAMPRYLRRLREVPLTREGWHVRRAGRSTITTRGGGVEEHPAGLAGDRWSVVDGVGKQEQPDGPGPTRVAIAPGPRRATLVTVAVDDAEDRDRLMAPQMPRCPRPPYEVHEVLPGLSGGRRLHRERRPPVRPAERPEERCGHGGWGLLAAGDQHDHQDQHPAPSRDPHHGIVGLQRAT